MAMAIMETSPFVKPPPCMLIMPPGPPGHLLPSFQSQLNQSPSHPPAVLPVGSQCLKEKPMTTKYCGVIKICSVNMLLSSLWLVDHMWVCGFECELIIDPIVPQ